MVDRIAKLGCYLLGLVWLASQLAAASVVTLAKATFFPQSLNCSSATTFVSIIGELGVCLEGPSMDVGAANSSLLLDSDKNSTKVYSTFNCSGVPDSEYPWTTCTSVPQQQTSAILTPARFINETVFRVSYYATNSCQDSAPVTYSSLAGVLTTGVFDLCLTNGVLASQSFNTTQINATFVNSTTYPGAGCINHLVRFDIFPIAQCILNKAMENTTTPYMMIVVPMPSPSPPKYPQFFIGQVDLNAGASQLNAQIVGASVGILCGIATVLVVLSFFDMFEQKVD